MSFSKSICLVLALIFASTFAFVGCSQNQDNAEILPGADIRFVDGVQVDYDNIFFDDFVDGVDYDTWFIGKQAWGANENGGVIPQNVNYTDEGVLVFTGNGEYYTSGEVSGVGGRKDGSLTGGALISKFVTGPGRYEIKMKVLPRLGACSAFWTYCYEMETEGNHEIDIELPGGKDAFSGLQTFENVLNTNYITVSNNESQDVNFANTTGSKTVALNDGEWHTFGFDWYTNPQKVVYYIDGKVTAVSNLFVPYVQARIWLGVWFPNNSGFVGDANFESDVMQVDYVKHIPFLNQDCQTYDPAISSSQVATKDEYPTAPVANSKVNKIANGDFEFATSQENVFDFGWQTKAVRLLTTDERQAIRDTVTEELTAQNPTMDESELKKLINKRVNEIVGNYYGADPKSLCTIAGDIGLDNTCGVKIVNLGRMFQEIDAVYQGYKLNLQFKAKGSGSVIVEFYSRGSETSIQRNVITVNSSDWQDYSEQLVAPAGTTKVNVIIQTDNYDGGEIFADQFVLQIN